MNIFKRYKFADLSPTLDSPQSVPERKKELLAARFPIFKEIYDDMVSYRGYSLIGDFPNIDRIYISDDPEIDGTSVGHVTTLDANQDGMVDSIRVNLYKVDKLLSGLNSATIAKVKQTLKGLKEAPDATQEYPEFNQDLLNYLNSIVSLTELLRHEQIHLEGQTSGGGNFTEEALTKARGEQEAQKYYEEILKDLPESVRNRLSFNLTKSSSLYISGSKKMISKLQSVYKSLLEKEEYDLAKEAYGLIKEFKKVANEGARTDYGNSDAQVEEEDRFIANCGIILDLNHHDSAAQGALANIETLCEMNSIQLQKDVSTMSEQEKSEALQIKRKFCGRYIPPCMAAMTIRSAMGQGEIPTDMEMAIIELEETMSKLGNDKLRGLAAKLVQTAKDYQKKTMPEEAQPSQMIKEQSRSSRLNKTASYKPTFRDIQNEFTAFTRSTTLKTYGK